jgi:hypothetical protein
MSKSKCLKKSEKQNDETGSVGILNFFFEVSLDI